jgi:hypothetical protein
MATGNAIVFPTETIVAVITTWGARQGDWKRREI